MSDNNNIINKVGKKAEEEIKKPLNAVNKLSKGNIKGALGDSAEIGVGIAIGAGITSLFD